jgi:hypothetical protein
MIQNHLQNPHEVQAWVLIVCSTYNVSQSLVMYQQRWVQVSWWPFSPPCGRKDKHQGKKNKNACQIAMLNGSMSTKAK